MPTDNPGTVAGDVLLSYTMPQAEYMYGCTATAVGMLLGYYDLYGYRSGDITYDMGDLIEGTISVYSRGSDGTSIYDMKDPSLLADFIASADYVSRFYGTSSEDELPYTFVDGDPAQGLNVSVWNCLADYLGTGQYWRSNGDLSTTYYYASLSWANTTGQTLEIGDLAVPCRYIDFKYGLSLYVQSRGFELDPDKTESFIIGSGGSFTFSDFMAEIDAGRPVLLSMEAPGGYGHSVLGCGYNAATQEVIFDDTYRSDCRMTWTGTYSYGGNDYSLDGATTVVFRTDGLPIYSGVPAPPGTTTSGAVISGHSALHGGDTMIEATVNAGGHLYVSSGGLASATTVNSGGSMYVSSGGQASATTVNSGGRMTIYESGSHLGSLQIESGAVVSAYEGARIGFDIAERDAGDGALINNLALIKGTPSYFISVSAAQAESVYTLAGGASGFTGILALAAGEENYGSITVNGNVLTHGSHAFTLATRNGALLLTVDDGIAPEVLSVTPSTTAPTNQDVTVTATFNDNTRQKQYSTDGTTWKSYTSGVVMTANGTVYFRGIDGAGNISNVAGCTVANIDREPPAQPAASADITVPTRENVTVSATFSSDSVLKQYSADGTTWETYTSGVVMTGNGTLWFRGIDAAGNISEVTSYTVSNIDKVAPSAPTASADITAPTNGDVTVSAIFCEDSAVR